MKQVNRLPLYLLLCALLPLIAATAGLADDSDVTVRHLADGAIEYDTTDPFGNDVTVVIDPPLENPYENPWDVPGNKLFRGFEVDEADKFFPMKHCATVPVYAAGDEEYRSYHGGNWTSRLYQIIETADNAYYRDFCINWIIYGYYNWYSSGGNASAILSDLASDFSGFPDGLVQGFTRDSNFDAGGIAYVYGYNPGTGYSVCVDQGSTWTPYALRHEIGHNYGAYHDYDPVVCMMNYTYTYSIDYFHSSHDSLVYSHHHWF
ncbi:MAG: hypothetical protein GY856_29160 [bacterium]|nr:hypothetical protein [bacterium]